jgi:hypothetical protein
MLSTFFATIFLREIFEILNSPSICSFCIQLFATFILQIFDKCFLNTSERL